jgi:hypothetical protein
MFREPKIMTMEFTADLKTPGPTASILKQQLRGLRGFENFFLFQKSPKDRFHFADHYHKIVKFALELESHHRYH